MANLVKTLHWIGWFLIFSDGTDAFALKSSLLDDRGMWHMISSADGINIYEHTAPVGPIVPLKAEMIVEVPMEQVISVLDDRPRKKEWMPRLEENYLVEEMGYYQRLEYARIRLPWPFKDRSLLVDVEITVNADSTRVMIVGNSVEDKRVAQSEDTVRAKVYESGIEIVRVGDRTRFSMLIFTDPQGNVPMWLVNFFSRGVARQTLEQLRKQFYKPLYTKEHLSRFTWLIKDYNKLSKDRFKIPQQVINKASFSHSENSSTLKVPLDINHWILTPTGWLNKPMIDFTNNGIRLKTENNAGGLIYLFDQAIPIEEGKTFVNWNWSVKKFPLTNPKPPFQRKNDDFALRVGMLISGGNSEYKIPWALKRKLSKAHQDLKLNTIIWYSTVAHHIEGLQCARTPVEKEFFTCLYPAGLKNSDIVIPIDEHLLNILRIKPVDFSKFQLVGLWLFADSDDSGSMSEAFISDIEIYNSNSSRP